MNKSEKGFEVCKVFEISTALYLPLKDQTYKLYIISIYIYILLLVHTTGMNEETNQLRTHEAGTRDRRLT